MNVGVERKFYDDGAVSVDDDITDLEGPFANCRSEDSKEINFNARVAASTI